ncbi:tyrosine-type recombinase/integrase [Massilia aurea]|nr:site-specific integrase [Massilia aurea]
MMASIAKRPSGWRAQIAIQGVRESRVFATKTEATAWAAQRETQIRTEKSTGIQRGRTVQAAFERYQKEVSAHKRGADKEAIRLAAIGRMVVDGKPLKEWKLADITSEVLGKWRDQRLLTVKGSSVNRDLNLLSHVFASAVREWKWIATSPTTDVRRPADPPPRDRLYTADEIDRLCAAMGIDVDQATSIETTTQRVGIAFLFAIETAMRAGEICGLTAANVNGRVATLPRTKNGTKRDVPLSSRAVTLLKLLPEPEEGGALFGLTTASVDALFRKSRNRAMVEEATFHDTRHLAITRLAKKLHVLDLARMTGHKDLKKLQIYYNESAEDMATRLD